jgi:hypothetical protein
MKNFNSNYEAIILREARDPKYRRHLRWIWGVYGFFAVLLFSVYMSLFNPGLVRNIFVAVRIHRMAHGSSDQTLQAAVFIYENIMLMLAFFCLVGVFLSLGVLAFDMQRRNAVIRSLLPPADIASASEKDNS